MSDEQKNDETTEETPVQDENATSAGPVAESDDSSSQAAGESPDATPPADEAPAADAEATTADEGSSEDAAAEEEAPAADEGLSEDAPAEEEAAPPAAEAAPAAEPDPEDDLPWKERRRLQRSRRPNEAKPTLSPEDRAAQRREERKLKASQRRTERAGEKAKKGPTGTGTPAAEREANAAKVRQGIVVSNKGNKSITVRIDIARRHPTYEKIVRRSRTLHAHDERNEAGEGDVVRVIETRPLSKTKRWRLVDVVEKAR
jgi:small subunit ribosomal protein S17